MSEQKYYVQINKKLWNNLNPLQLGGVGIDLCQSEYGYGEYFIAEYEPESSYAKVNKNSFTKSELAKIMDGACIHKRFLRIAYLLITFTMGVAKRLLANG